MAVGESVSNGTIWDTRRPPRGNSALPSMGALLGGPYNTPPIHGTLVDTLVLIRAKEAQQSGTPKRVPVQRFRVVQLDRTQTGGGRELEQRRLISLGLRKGFLFRDSGWDSWTEPRQVGVES